MLSAVPERICYRTAISTLVHMWKEQGYETVLTTPQAKICVDNYIGREEVLFLSLLKETEIFISEEADR